MDFDRIVQDFNRVSEHEVLEPGNYSAHDFNNAAANKITISPNKERMIFGSILDVALFPFRPIGFNRLNGQPQCEHRGEFSGFLCVHPGQMIDLVSLIRHLKNQLNYIRNKRLVLQNWIQNDVLWEYFKNIRSICKLVESVQQVQMSEPCPNSSFARHGHGATF